MAANPISLSLNGLAFSPGLDKSFFSHPTLADSDPVTGMQILVETGVWSEAAIENPVALGGVLSADTTSLSVFEPFEVTPLGPTVSTVPNPAFDFIVGIVMKDQTVTAKIKVKNIGGGTLNGAASLINNPSNAFSIVGSGAYNLTHNQTQDITIRFAPTAEGDFTATLRLSGGDNSPVDVTVRGTGTLKAKRFTVFGCAPSESSGGRMGDLAVMGIALIGLMALSRAYRRSRQS